MEAIGLAESGHNQISFIGHAKLRGSAVPAAQNAKGMASSNHRKAYAVAFAQGDNLRQRGNVAFIC